MAKKKSFIESAQLQNDPALSFISHESLARIEGTDDSVITVEIDPAPEPEGRFRQGRSEVKSRRVQLVMQPSLYSRVRDASIRAGLSLNEYCHRALEDAVKNNGR